MKHLIEKHVEKMFIVYLSLVLMKTKAYQRINIKEGKVWNHESRTHKFIDILKVNEIDLDVKLLNCNSFCINFRCSEKSHTFITKVPKIYMHQDIPYQV